MWLTENWPRYGQQIAGFTVIFFFVIFFESIIVNVQNNERKDIIGYRLIISHFTSSRVICMLITVALLHMLS